MTASTAGFFDELTRRGHEALLERVSATVRFDIADAERIEHRLVRIDHGDILVAADDEPADCVIGADHEIFDAMLVGRMSLMTALLRGVLAVEGDPELLVLAQRLFPRPAAASAGRDAVGGGRRTS